jgi:hypothetical protein
MHQMDESPDDPKPPKAPDDPGIQTRPTSPLELSADDEGVRARPVRRSPVPLLTVAASVLLILAAVLNFVLIAFRRFLAPSAGAGDLLLAGVAAVLIWDAVLLLRGRHKAPGRAGVVFALLGLYFLGEGLTKPGGPGPLSLVVVLVYAAFGLPYLASGVLLLVGRRAYLAWQKENAQADVTKALQVDLDATRGDREERGSVNQGVQKGPG